MVPDTVRVAVGILGNAASMLLYTTPILTFRWVIRKGNVEEFSCVPYILALLNCLLYTWYGLPVVSSGWENLPVATINGLGILLEVAFIAIYLRFAPAEKKRFALQLVLPALALFGLTAALSSFAARTHRSRKAFVGSVGLVASVSMYTSPMVAAKRVIATKSVEFMPFSLSLFSFLSSALWMAYGLLGRDLFIASPNFIGVPVGVLQLLLYCIYRRDHGAAAGAEAQAHGPAAAADQEKGMKAAAPVAVQPQEVAARVSEYK
ncbi:bidirectional sugar transporter SWEET3b [Zea mays]|uniref:bidirectional sugar transporter SWEET3b n=1 Tax=Zea mays TaxID=4577 RepID=UPI0004DEB8B8|nr:bidirectional sugar transporter SWEET3b [Zea mays]|eukprot:XP_008673522.1 bidirectional sugar transporter SWEET3b [Zea mays]